MHTHADKLLGGLGGEKVRWQDTVARLDAALGNLVGDVLVAAGTIAYAGPFVPSYRAVLLAEWTQLVQRLRVPHTPGTCLVATMQEPVRVRAWAAAGLPSDAVSVESGLIATSARRWPLCIDPQGQANRWLRCLEREAGLQVLRPNDKDVLRGLENGVRFGRPVLLEDVGESLDAALEPLLLRQTFRQGGGEVIRLGDSVVPYHRDFRFYITTKLRNPHYPPEVAVKVCLLNFFATPEGLEEQLLANVVTQERPDLATLKGNLVVTNARMRGELQVIEDRILQLLSASAGNILDDQELVDTLAQAKVTSNEIAARVAEAEATEQQIDAARERYRPVAARGSTLFFAVSDLGALDPMYQFSLAWFNDLFARTVEAAPKAESVEERGQLLNDHFTYFVYLQVCRCLFERHKLLFSLLLASRIQAAAAAGGIDAAEWRFLLAGPSAGLAAGTTAAAGNPCAAWLPNKAWAELFALGRLPAFAGIQEHVAGQQNHYRAMLQGGTDAKDWVLGQPWQARLSAFQALLPLRCLRPDKLLEGIRAYVSATLGPRFVEPPPLDLAAAFRDGGPGTPLLFVLSPGADPMADLLKLAAEMRFSKRFEAVSLGQGQGPRAERLLVAGMESGAWVCLQNCHLASSWMPSLERIVEGIQPDKVHRDFRLWLTSAPSASFPVSVLQRSVKVGLEPPAGLRANLLRQYGRFDDAYLVGSERPAEWRCLLFGMCLFHAVVQDRRRFGPLGWNIPYDFTDGDLAVSLAQLHEYLQGSYLQPPFKVLRYLFAEINYGGRVTDDKDRRLMSCLLQRFCAPEVLQEGHAFSPSATYVVPGCETMDQVLEHVRAYPLAPAPDIYGLHDNADIACRQGEAYALLGGLLALQPRSTGGGGSSSQEDAAAQLATDILAQLPAPFDLSAIAERYPISYAQSMNTVLVQEAGRYNALTALLRSSLRQVVAALRGQVVMSPELEALAAALYDNKVPEAWAARAYPSLKPLAAWVSDLLRRLAFLTSWVQHGPPPVFWLSGLFFPQAFLTGTLQNYARSHALAIDTISFGFQVMDGLDAAAWSTPPGDGCYVTGLFLEAAAWDDVRHTLAEPQPRELFAPLPVLWLRPELNRVRPQLGVYECPVYKTTARAGTLSTTGHSTNYILSVELPSSANAAHWVNRGAALFAALAF